MSVSENRVPQVVATGENTKLHHWILLFSPTQSQSKPHRPPPQLWCSQYASDVRVGWGDQWKLRWRSLHHPYVIPISCFIGTTPIRKTHMIIFQDFLIISTCCLFLVGGWATPLKNMSSSIGMMRWTQYLWENKKLMATKPPTSHYLNMLLGFILPLLCSSPYNWPASWVQSSRDWRSSSDCGRSSPAWRLKGRRGFCGSTMQCGAYQTIAKLVDFTEISMVSVFFFWYLLL